MRNEKGVKLSQKDIEILRLLQKDCRMSLDEIAKKLNMSKSTVHYRVKRLREAGIIEGCYAKLNPMKVGKEYITVTFVRAKYGPEYHEKVGDKLAKIRGVWAVYFVLGDIDFIVLARADSRDDVMRIIDEFMHIEGIERTSTQVVVKVIKEDPTVDLKSVDRS